MVRDSCGCFSLSGLNDASFKRGQVSIFILIGVILIIVVAFMVFNSKVDFFVSKDARAKNQISEIVEDCLYNSLDSGVFLLGQQGGYIEIPRDVISDPKKYSNLGVKIPTWDVMGGKIPTIESMQDELNRFIERNAYSCIVSSLNNLTNIYQFNYSDVLNVTTTITDSDVIVEASFPIKFREVNSDEVLSVKDYVVSLKDINLGDLYNLAFSIYKTEASSYFLEDLVIEQIYSDSDYRLSSSMPGQGMDISCYRRIWTYGQLKRNLANLNNHNFKYLQLVGTASKDSFIDNSLKSSSVYKEAKEYFSKIYRINLVDKRPSFKNYFVDVFMPSTEVNNVKNIIQRYPFRKFEVYPSSNQVVKSSQLKVLDKIPVPCIQFYNHVYSLDYDLIFRLRDLNDDRGFYFQFPIRVQIEKNNPKRKVYTPFSFVEKRTLNSEKFCSNESKKYPVMVLTTDINDNPLSDVEITYKCMDLVCDLGVTKRPVYMGITRKYAVPQLIAKFPYCYNGYVIGRKDGYYPAKVRLKTDDSLLGRSSFVGDNLVTLKLIPYKEFPIDSPENFLIIFKEDGTGYRVLTEDDGYIYVNIHSEKYNFDSYAIWPNSEDTSDYNKLKFLDLDGVKYNLTAYYSDKDYNLKGYLELINWTPNIHSGNRIQIIIPGTRNIIEPENFKDFYDYVKKKSAVDRPRFY